MSIRDEASTAVNISEPFIRRPVATILLTIGVALAGSVAFTLLPTAPLPKLEVPAIFVSAVLPGASPEVMASSVATPLERHLGAIADVDDMTSTSYVGLTNIQMTFGLDRDLDVRKAHMRRRRNEDRLDGGIGTHLLIAEVSGHASTLRAAHPTGSPAHGLRRADFNGAGRG